MSAQITPRYTLEEYFALELASDARWEWFDGEIFCMSGVSPSHGQLEINFAALLRNQFQGRDCRVFPANVRLKVPSAPPYRYGDLSALCGKATFEEIGGIEAVTNPSVIIEILSPSTEAYDRGDKFTYYKSIPSLREYVLVAQHRPHVSHFVKEGNNSWMQTEVNDLASSLYLPSVDCTLPLAEIYAGIEFSKAMPALVSPEDAA